MSDDDLTVAHTTGRRRSVGTATCSRLGARSVSPVAGSGRAKPPVMRRGEQDEAR